MACIRKDMIFITRTRALLLLFFLLPFLQISFMLLYWGGEPKKLPIAVINEDYSTFEFSLSEKFLVLLENCDTVEVYYYNSIESAFQAVDKMNLKAVVHIGQNFTSSFVTRQIEPNNTSAEITNENSLSISMDETVKLTAMILQGKIVEVFEQVELDFLEIKSNQNNFTIGDKSPVKFIRPFYGEEVETLTDYMTPG